LDGRSCCCWTRHYIRGFVQLTVSHDLLLDSTSNRERSKLSRESCILSAFSFIFSPRRHVESTGVHSWQNWK
jgi:hypothetical protein